MKIFLISFLLVKPLFSATIIIDNKKYSSKELLKHPSIESVKIQKSTYKKPFTFKAIPLSELITDIKGSYITFKSKDGFASTIPVKSLFHGKSVTYLAIENTKKPWPKYNKKLSPGPFYLIWEINGSERIGQEWWPFQITKISFSTEPKVLYPKLYPKSLSSKAKKGFNVFVKNCFSCHKLQKMGTAIMGPDLNHPMNPTDYFKEGILKKFIRNPAHIRDWPDRQMPGFSKEEITDLELNYLILYLKEIRKLI